MKHRGVPTLAQRKRLLRRATDAILRQLIEMAVRITGNNATAMLEVVLNVHALLGSIGSLATLSEIRNAEEILAIVQEGLSQIESGKSPAQELREAAKWHLGGSKGDGSKTASVGSAAGASAAAGAVNRGI